MSDCPTNSNAVYTLASALTSPTDRKDSYIEVSEPGACDDWKGLDLLKQPTKAVYFTETVMNWSAPNAGSDVTVRIDSFELNLIVEETHFFNDTQVVCVIPISKMTDFRKAPYYDETKHGQLDTVKDFTKLPSDYATRFFGVAFYKDNLNFVDVNLASFLISEPNLEQRQSTLQQWRTGLAALIKHNSEHNPRYVTLQERVTRMYSNWLGHAEGGLVKLSVLKKIFGEGQQWNGVLKLVESMKPSPVSKGMVDTKQCTHEWFQTLMEDVFFLPQVTACFKKILGNDTAVTPETFLTGVLEKHRDPLANEVLDPVPTIKTAENVIKEYGLTTDGDSANELSCRGFYRFLQDAANDFINPKARQVDPNSLTKPIASYYCFSSHNSYLSGHQITGRSVVEMYRQILLSGCRCVELDIWDGADFNENSVPIVSHTPKYTFTTKVLFEDCIKAIAETAFITSDYPVVLSFENHCSMANQQEMARICIKEFGTLLSKGFASGHGGVGTLGASPEYLKHKILIKNKRLKELEVQIGVDHKKSKHLSTPNAKKGQGGSKVSLISAQYSISSATSTPTQTPTPTPTPTPNLTSTQVIHAESEGVGDLEVMSLEIDGEVVTETEQELLDRASRSKNRTKALSDLVNYVWPVQFKGFDVAAQTQNHYHMSSFAEKKAEKLVLGQPDEFSTYTVNQIARIYPRGDRISSSNYQPMFFWCVGAQMVALNFQTDDTAMRVNRGRFLSNGCCGYVRKPEPFLSPNFDPMTQLPIDNVISLDVEITVLAACTSGERRQVLIDTFGLGKDGYEDFKTKLNRGSKAVAIWGGNEKLTLSNIALPEQLMVYINVVDQYGVSVGWECVCAADLRPGHHFIPLRGSRSPLDHVFIHVEADINAGKHGKMADRLENPMAFSSNRKTDVSKQMMTKYYISDTTDSDTPKPDTFVPMEIPMLVDGELPMEGLDSGTKVTRADTDTSIDFGGLDHYDVIRRREEVVTFEVECKQNLKENTDEGLATLATFSATETKAMAAMREKHRKARNAVFSGHNKALLRARRTFMKATEALFNSNSGASSKVGDNVKAVHTQLIQFEIAVNKMTKAEYVVFVAKIHELMKTHETEIGQLKLDELQKIHAKRMTKTKMYRSKRLDFALELMYKQFFDQDLRNKKYNADATVWKAFKEGAMMDMLAVLQKTRKLEEGAMGAETAQIQKQLDMASQELETAQAWDIDTMNTFYDEQLLNVEEVLNADIANPKTIRWNKLTFKQYKSALVDANRIPPL